MIDCLENEIWKDISGYEGLYQISNLGRIKSLARNGCGSIDRIISQQVNNFGYLTAVLRNKCKAKRHLVHRLIARAFIDNNFNKPVINHKDGMKTNNSIENLEWVTTRENVIHAMKTGLRKEYGKGRPFSDQHKQNLSRSFMGRKPTYGRKGKKWSEEMRIKIIAANKGKSRNKGKIAYEYPVIQLTKDNIFIKEWASAAKASLELGYSHATGISACCNNRQKTYKGYIWKFKDKK